jgi:hypothetical protein
MEYPGSWDKNPL